WLEAVVARLLAKDPADRFQTAAEVAALLSRRLAQLQTGANPTDAEAPGGPVVATTLVKPGAGRRRFRPLPWALVALVGVGGVVAGWFIQQHWPSQREPAGGGTAAAVQPTVPAGPGGLEPSRRP